MTYAFLAPLPIFATMLAAALVCLAWLARRKWVTSARRTRERMGDLERLIGETARKVCELERELEKKADRGVHAGEEPAIKGVTDG